jgi:hypothetical protein
MFTQEWMNARQWRTKEAPDVLIYSCDENNLQSIFDGAIAVEDSR